MKLYSKFLLIILIVPIKVDAQTVIDITQGSEDPYRLAIIAKEGNQKPVSYTHLTLPTKA